MKQPKTEPTAKPKVGGVESVVNITKIALTFRGTDKPNIAEIGRLVGRASGLLGIDNLDERLEIQNKAAFQIAREMGLMD